MADDSNEKQSSSKDFLSTKSAIFEACNELKKWREEQMKQFQSLQQLENEKFNLINNADQNYFETALKQATSNHEAGDYWKKDLNYSNVSSANGNDTADSSNTLQESSITGHLKRCFDDSSQSNLSLPGNKIAHDIVNLPLLAGIQSGKFSEKILNAGKDKIAKNTENSTESKPRRPFLKKGTGLLRYMPKSHSNTARKKVFTATYTSPKKNTFLPQRTLNLKPAIRTSSAPTERVKHIRFDIPGGLPVETNDLVDSLSNGNKVSNGVDQIDSSQTKGQFNAGNFASENRSEENSNPLPENLNLSKENRELEEFELLENFAQNSSFNSDSSIVQKVLQGENVKVLKNQIKVPNSSDEQMNGTLSKEQPAKPSGNSIFSAKMDLNKCRDEWIARKEILQKVISDINPRIQSLQKEIASCNPEHLDDSDVSERCSTPIEDLSADLKELPNESDQSLDVPNFDMENGECDPRLRSCNVNDVHQDVYPYKGSMKEIDSCCEISDTSPESNQVMNDKQRIREKLKELEKEIAIYQEHNKKLSSICKERDEVLRKIQKEHSDFNKYKEAEKKKLEAEIQEERKQIKRQKETFARYQKLRKDNPTKKEREELNALRQEIEKLQEDLKRQRIKYTNDCRRMKNQLDAAERERDSFKLENIRLEEQVQDLLAALKARLKNNPETLMTEINKKTNEDKFNLEATSSDKILEVQSKTKVAPDKPKTFPKENVLRKEHTNVHLDVTDQNNKPKNTEYDSGAASSSNDKQVTDTDAGAKQSFPNVVLENDTMSEISEISEQYVQTNCGVQKKTVNLPGNLSKISFTVESEFREIDHGNKIERIHASGEREIIFNSGTRKIIGIDGKIKTMFYNGDTKEIFPDKREVYKYVNGVIETHFPDGLEVTEFPNGQTQRCYPDGQKEVKFPDGTMHNLYADGSEEIKSADGNVVNLSSDGTETIVFANGQKEIRTATYKRREFPDGSVKIIYDSGRQETRYSNGRIKIKDKDGKVIVDTKYLGITKDS